MDRNQVPVDVYGLVSFQQKKDKIERPGFMFNPIIAVSITSASRLLLATTEVLLSKYGATHAYCDTDSMAVSPQYTKDIQKFFQVLNLIKKNDCYFIVRTIKLWHAG